MTARCRHRADPCRADPCRAGRRRGVALGALRAAWGLALLWAPGRVLGAAGARAATGDGRGGRATAVVRVLGCRHVVQGLLAVASWPRWWRTGVAADAAHAASMVGLGAAHRRWRCPALADAAVAGAFAVAGSWAAGSGQLPGRRAGAGPGPMPGPGCHRR